MDRPFSGTRKLFSENQYPVRFDGPFPLQIEIAVDHAIDP